MCGQRNRVKTHIGAHLFPAHSPPTLSTALQRKTRVLLVACEVLHDTPVTSSAPARPPFHCICPALCPSLSLFRPLHLFFPPPSLCPRFLISDLSSNVICPERPTSPPQPECLLSPPSHMAAGHSPALVLSSWHVWYLK